MKTIDLVIIGGGSAGMAAAISAHEHGCRDILILERDQELGGILEQCIHNGFGLQVFKEELSGPAFAEKLKKEVEEKKIPYRLQAMVVSIDEQRIVSYVHERDGFMQIQAKAIILACGCYERNRGAISIPGTRVKGIYTAGTAQRYLNMENTLVGKRVFILGSGDIGLIMARRMTLEGATVLGVAELMPYSNGLTRNIVQCLKDFDIPLYLSHTITNIEGKDHVEAVTISQVDEKNQPIKGTEKRFAVDTLLLSVGLIPENSLANDANIMLDPRTKGAIVNERLETSIPHIYACGNALHVHDLVDFVTMEARSAGEYAAMDLLQDTKEDMIDCKAEGLVSYVVPQKLHRTIDLPSVMFSFRVKKPCKHAVIEIVNQNGICKSIKKPVLLPAEMIRIPIAVNDFKDSEELIVKVREEA